MTNDKAPDEDDILYIARLARLRLPDNERSALAKDIGRILQYVKKLEEIDTSAISPTTHALKQTSALRKDEAHAGLPTEVGLRGAPDPIANGFGVPTIIQGKK